MSFELSLDGIQDVGSTGSIPIPKLGLDDSQFHCQIKEFEEFIHDEL